MINTISKTIQFPVTVAGKNLIAEVIRPVNIPVSVGFLIRFSDGFEDEFQFCGEVDYLATSDESGRPYAEAIFNDFPQPVWFDPSLFYHVFRDIIGGKLINVWINQKKSESGKECYGVYHGGDYHFELSRVYGDKEWTVSTQRKIDPYIDHTLANKVKELLDSLL